MIRIESNVLYTRGELAEMLKPAGVDVDYFVARLRPRKVLRFVFFGEDILAALRTAPALAEHEESGGGPVVAYAAAAVVGADRRRGGKAARIDDDPSAALKRYRNALKGAGAK